MASVERTITVSTPLSRVWPYLADFTTTEEWDPPTVSTTRTSGDGGVGTTYHNVSSFLGKETEADYTVVRREEESVLELEGEAGSVGLHDTITLTGTPEGGTEVTYHAEFHPSGAAKLAEPLLPPALKVLGDKVAASMAERLEQL
ncbi:polyketide cyclase [Nocardioides anomalus]|uniref:Polyketide cyclase n=1 Tax=Nocardioides anomalus TaxID=2712223 RepID=A0A6G6WAB0_9ACTN|nr:SRPBCC family protein [Nocardioides anomalus]QIG42083.1 polyketide cyclase [Nocardioides anomalus]